MYKLNLETTLLFTTHLVSLLWLKIKIVIELTKLHFLEIKPLKLYSNKTQLYAFLPCSNLIYCVLLMVLLDPFTYISFPKLWLKKVKTILSRHFNHQTFTISSSATACTCNPSVAYHRPSTKRRIRVAKEIPFSLGFPVLLWSDVSFHQGYRSPSHPIRYDMNWIFFQQIKFYL